MEYDLERWGLRAWYAEPCPGWDPACPSLDVLVDLLGRGLVPPSAPGDRGKRLDALRRAGHPIPPEWVDRGPTEAEAEAWWELLCVSALAWREVAVPIPGRAPYRLDIVVLAPLVDWRRTEGAERGRPLTRPLASFREAALRPRPRARFQLVAVEVDGGSHERRVEHDARRDRYVLERFGVRTLRFPAETSPDRIAAEVLPYRRFEDRDADALQDEEDDDDGW